MAQSCFQKKRNRLRANEDTTRNIDSAQHDNFPRLSLYAVAAIFESFQMNQPSEESSLRRT